MTNTTPFNRHIVSAHLVLSLGVAIVGIMAAAF
jgi:hypothetical protein